MRGLRDKAIILTGGASGIGREAAIRLGVEGAMVGIFDLDEAGARATVEQIGSDRSAAYHVDISDREQVTTALAAFESRFGPTRGLANEIGRAHV